MVPDINFTAGAQKAVTCVVKDLARQQQSLPSASYRNDIITTEVEVSQEAVARCLRVAFFLSD